MRFLPPADSVYGIARDGLTGTPLSGVRVEVTDRLFSTVSDGKGEYALAIPFPGRHRLRFSRAQYDSLVIDVTVPVAHSVRLDVELQPHPLELPSIEVFAGTAPDAPLLSDGYSADPAEVGLRRFTRESLRTDPLAVDRDPILTIAQSPGTAAQGGFPSSLHIRGGSSDQNLVLLDGVPVYGAMHLGGVAGIFNPDAIERVDLHPAVPPANLSGRLSSMINIEIRPGSGTRPALSGGWTPMSLRQLFETPFDGGQGSLLLSLRRSYRGILAADPGDGEKPNRFEDYLFRAGYAGGRDSISIYVVQSSDRVGFAAVAQPGNSQGQIADTAFNRFHWSSNTQALVWRHAGNVDHRLSGRVWHAGAAAGVDWSPADDPQRLTSTLDETGMRLEFLRADNRNHRLAGVELRHLDVRYDVTTGATSSETTSTFLPVHLVSGPTMFGAYLEEGRRIGTRLSVVVGMHANYVARFGVQLEPRLSARYRLTTRVSLSLGYARLYQYVQSLRNEESLLDRVFGADLPVGVGSPGLGPARSDQISAGLVARIAPQSALRIDSYVRDFRNLASVAAVTGAPFAERMVPAGRGHAEGLALELTHHSNRLNVATGAGGARTVRESGLTEFSPGALRSYWAVLGLGYRLSNVTTLHFSGSWGAGSPATVASGSIDWHPSGVSGLGGEISGSPEAIVGSLSQSRLPSYFRTDLGIERLWGVTIMGRPGVLTTSLTLSNLLNRHNVLGYVAEAGSFSRRQILYPPRSLGFQVGWEF